MDPTAHLLEVRRTADGSRTLFNPVTNEPYASMYGAASESRHVFINAGFHAVEDRKVRVLEIGLGTGLNLLLTMEEARRTGRAVEYVAVEPYPLEQQRLDELDHCTVLRLEHWRSAYNECMSNGALTTIQPFGFTCSVVPRIDEISCGPYHLIYYDAFAPKVQAELWTVDQFQRMHELLRPSGVLVTYCAKAAVRRAMQQVGFSVERLPGPPGKSEMLRATKPL
ncbi:MAG: tRNA (5-methylaminomethyl-2-thiouridine)(34)-methyltransferase MnmD [Flavobacteriales bacterium]